jgi:hypothetical protein
MSSDFATMKEELLSVFSKNAPLVCFANICSSVATEEESSLSTICQIMPPDPVVAGPGRLTVSTSNTYGEQLDVCTTAPARLSDLTDCLVPDDSCGSFFFGIYRGNDRQEIGR